MGWISRNTVSLKPQQTPRASSAGAGTRRLHGPKSVVVLMALACLPGAVSTRLDRPQMERQTDFYSDALETGRILSRWFEEGELERLWPRLAPELQKVFRKPDGLRAFRQKVHASAGGEVAVLEERIVPWLASVIYNRAAHRSIVSELWWLQWTLADDRAGGFLVQPAPMAATSDFLEYETKTSLRLPFRGAWFVFWGGRTILENYHATSRERRFAYDFVVARRGRTSRGDAPRANPEYFCFGRPVLAPAGGVVLAAVGTVADNTPGQMNEEQPLGNHIVLDHGQREYSFLAHLKRGSLRVQRGQRVRSGEPLAQCGNSGRSSEPHVHFHLQTAPELGEGVGLPAQFRTYWANGRSVARGEPHRGQFVASGTESAFESLRLRVSGPWAAFMHDGGDT
jgi:hypothetical protein